MLLTMLLRNSGSGTMITQPAVSPPVMPFFQIGAAIMTISSPVSLETVGSVTVTFPFIAFWKYSRSE